MADPSVEEPLVTAVIPTYGRSEMLREGVLAQTYDALELVVVDDASPEPVEPLLADRVDETDREVSCLRHETNQGANAARNTGIRAADGEFIAFLDDDDQWEPDSVARRVAGFDGRPSVGVVYSDARTVAEDGTVLHETTSAVSGDATTALLRGAVVGSFSRVMVRRSVIDRAGTPDERFPSWQDWEWYLRLSEHCQFEHVSSPLTVRRVEDDRITDDHEQKRDVSYPLLLEKHRDTAEAHGWVWRRRFEAACARSVAASALQNGFWGDAVRFSLLAARRYPFSSSTALYLALSLGGPGTFRPAQAIKRRIANLRHRSS
jgi:glycosyltransferase involved in cell wall biosynthesis